MNMRNESEMNRMLTMWLEAAGAMVLPVVGSTFQRAGWPDRYVAHRSWTGWLEGKKDDRQLSTAQRLCLRGLEARGVPAYEIKWASDAEVFRVKRHDGTLLTTLPWVAFAGVPARESGTRLLAALRRVGEMLGGST